MSMPISPLAGFFSIPAKAYEHFTITPSAARTLTSIIFAICAGVILAALYNFYIRRVPGGVVRLLLKRGALSPETALSAEELGLMDHPFALWELLRGVSLRHVVCTAPQSTDGEESGATDSDEAPSAEEEQAPDAKTRFYIPEDKKYRAEARFEEKGNGVAGLAVTCALTAVLGIVLLKLIPVALAMVDNFL